MISSTQENDSRLQANSPCDTTASKAAEKRAHIKTHHHIAGRKAGGDAAQTRVCTTRVYTRASLSAYSFKQRILIRLADVVFYALINIVGHTARFQVEGWKHWEEATRDGGAPIYTFWHNRILLGTYFWRGRGIVVMTSRSFDGEYIARFIQRFGYGAARGSSTRGGTGAFVEMARLARSGVPTGFSIDGPRGPRYVAKMGAVLLAKKTGQPVLPMTFIAARHWEAKSWDRFQVPFPFTRALVRIAPPIRVPADADDELLRAKRDELQRALNSLDDDDSLDNDSLDEPT